MYAVVASNVVVGCPVSMYVYVYKRAYFSVSVSVSSCLLLYCFKRAKRREKMTSAIALSILVVLLQQVTAPLALQDTQLIDVDIRPIPVTIGTI